MTEVTARDALSDAIQYWERRRILYNVVLIAVVGIVFLGNFTEASRHLNFDTLQTLFVLAVLANVAYCAAYPVDIAAQLSALRDTWLRWRWGLLAVGLIFAAILANFFSRGIFGVIAT